MKLLANFLSALAALIEGAAGFFASDDLEAFALQLDKSDEARECAYRQKLLERARIEWNSGSRPLMSQLREGELVEVFIEKQSRSFARR